MLRRSSFAIASLSLLLLWAADASAYRMWIEADRDVSTMVVGDRVSVDLHLDTQGESDILLLSVATFYDPTVLAFDGAASSANEHALYAPAGGSKGQASSYLEAWGVQEWGGHRPAIGGQVNSDFISNNLLSFLGTLATSDDEWMSTMVFEKIAEGDVAFLLTGEGGGNVFSIQGDDIMDDVEFGPPIGGGPVAAVPEPTAALLFGVGAVVFARRRSRHGR